MSSGRRLPLAEAELAASTLRNFLGCFCREALVVGSVRRQEAEVGDIEIALLPIYDAPVGNLFGEVSTDAGPSYRALDRGIGRLIDGGVLTVGPRQGMRQKTFFVGPGCRWAGVQVELYIADSADNWGNTVAIRTGPQVFSTALVTSRDAGGLMPELMYHKDGYLWLQVPGSPRERRKCPTERHFFTQLKVDYLPPWERSAEAVSLLRSGRYVPREVVDAYGDGVGYSRIEAVV